MLVYTVPLPYKSQAQKRRSEALTTINVQRNQHYTAAAQFKKNYSTTIRNNLPAIVPKYKACKILYKLHIRPTKGKPTKKDPYRDSVPKNIDLMNLLAVVDKVNSDVLVNEGLIPDDSIRYIQCIRLEVNPWSDADFIEITVTETQPIKDNRKP